MRVYILILCALLMQGRVGYAQTAAGNSKAPLKFEQEVIELGTVKEVDGVKKVTFLFKNTSKTPVVIQKIESSCGCTTPSFSREPIRPSQNGKIVVEFDPKNRPGKFTKVLYIYVTQSNIPIQIAVKGSVIGRPRTIEDDFPFEWGTKLRATMEGIIPMRHVERNKLKFKVIDIYNYTEQPLSPTVSVDKEFVHVTFEPTTLKPRERGQMIVRVDFSKTDLWGLNGSRITVKVGGETTHLDLSATVVDNFSLMSPQERKNAPIVEFSEMFKHFGTVKSGSIHTAVFTLKNNGVDDMIVRNCKGASEMLSCKIDKTVIESGDLATITLTLRVGVTKVNESVIVTVNDPKRPVSELRVIANVE